MSVVEMKLKIGDVVRLKCGGFPMVVDGFTTVQQGMQWVSNGYVQLTWHTAHGEKQELKTHQDALEHATPMHPYGGR